MGPREIFEKAITIRNCTLQQQMPGCMQWGEKVAVAVAGGGGGGGGGMRHERKKEGMRGVKS
jgi:hypothetical protein